MATRIEPLPGEAKTFQSHSGIDSMWITASTDHERVASVISSDHRVGSDCWAEWLAAHPGCVIATWFGVNDQEWRLRKHGEKPVRVTPPSHGIPWGHPLPVTAIASLPRWAIDALIDLGEVTTPEIEEEKAVKAIASMHMWGFRGMSLDICLTPIMQQFGEVA